MRRALHVISLTLLGFAAGLLVMLMLGHLPPIATLGQVADSSAVARPIASPAPPMRDSYADAVDEAAPAVVTIYGARAHGERVPPRHGPSTAQPSAARPPRYSSGHGGRGTSLGSGVVVSDGGLIVTNAHIIRGAERIDAELPDGRVLDVALLGVDDETDLAVLRAGDDSLPSIALGDTSKVRTGDVVLAIGNPFGIGQTVSLGIVSATGRSHLGLTSLENFIQTDAAINPGNSGGALIDTRGRLLGINTAIMSQSGLSEGVGFAIPSPMVMRVVDGLSRDGFMQRGWIGIGGQSVTPELAVRYGLKAQNGVLVSRVFEASPAAAAGVRAGDVVSRFGEASIQSSLQLRDMITAAAPGTAIPVELWRGSEQLETTIYTAERRADDGPVLRKDPVNSTVSRHQTGAVETYRGCNNGLQGC